MTNNNADFDLWFSNLSLLVLDMTGCQFNDSESVRSDYEDGRDHAEVASEIADEYNDMD